MIFYKYGGKSMKLEMLPYKNVNLKTNKVLEQLTLSSRALAESCIK